MVTDTQRVVRYIDSSVSNSSSDSNQRIEIWGLFFNSEFNSILQYMIIFFIYNLFFFLKMPHLLMSYLAIASGERIQRNFFQLSHLGNISSSGILCVVHPSKQNTFCVQIEKVFLQTIFHLPPHNSPPIM